MHICHVYTIIEFLCFSIAFHYYFPLKSLQHLIRINSIVFLIIAIAEATYIGSLWKFNTISHTYSSITLVIYAILYFYELLNGEMEINCWLYPMFWLSSGVLIYFGVNLFYFMLNNYLLSHEYHIASNGKNIHAAVNIFTNLIFSISFLCFKTFSTQ